jgi:hypothetical protein
MERGLIDRFPSIGIVAASWLWVAQASGAGTIRNIDGWYQAFGIKPGDPLYIAPKDRVHIW